MALSQDQINQLTSVLQSRGGLSQIDAQNQAQNRGGRAEELAREFGVTAPAAAVAPTGPSAADRTAFNERAGQTTSDFLTRFKTEFPQVLTGLESKFNLPQLRETAVSTVGALGDISKIVKATPERATQAARGFDVSAGQLERQIAAETGKLRPVLTEATTAAQQALTASQLGEQAFGTRAQLALAPFETEISFLKDQLSREATGFNIDVEGRFDILLQQIQTEGAANIATIQEATKLAQLEADKVEFESAIDAVDLGNRVILLDRSGNEVGSFPKGKLTGGGGSPWEYV